MINQFESAFGALLNAREAVFGTRQKATIAGTEVDADISELSFDPVLIPGGITETGTRTIQVKISDLPSQPADLSPVIINGETLSALRVTRVNECVYLIVVGDPASET